MALLTSIMIEELPSLGKSFRVSYLHILLPAPVVLKKTAFLLIMLSIKYTSDSLQQSLFFYIPYLKYEVAKNLATCLNFTRFKY